MKKKLLLPCLFLIALFFTSCNLSTNNSQMTIVNDSSETIDSIEVGIYLNTTSKATGLIIGHESLADGQEVAPGESVVYDLPTTESDTQIYVYLNTADKPASANINIEGDAVFTLHYKNESDDFTLSGSGAELFELQYT